MAADSYTATLGALLMGTGNDNNTWGANANTSVFQILEDSIANILSSAVTGGTLDLSGTPPPAGPSGARYWMLKFTGTLVSNQICQVPNLSKGWWVNNQTSGAFTLTFKTPSGSASTAIPQGGWVFVWCDAANVINVSPYASGQMLSPNGTAALPAQSWVNATSTGWYRAGAGDFRYSFAGTDQIKITSGVVNIVSGALQVAGVAVGTGTLQASGGVTAGHLATWASSTTLQDGGAAGALANKDTVTAQYVAGSAVGYNLPLNLQINATVSGNALTVAIKGIDTNDPSASNPVQVAFRNATITNGGMVVRSLAAALSMTVTATNTMGATSGVPFRLWVLLYDNAGTVCVGLFNASSIATPQIFALSEMGVISTASGTGGGNSLGTHYANASSLSNVACRVIGYIEWSAGLATAGTYNIGPTTIQLFGPGVKLPGQEVQRSYGSSTSRKTTTSSTPVATNLSLTIIPTSTINFMEVDARGMMAQNGGSDIAIASIYRDSASTQIGSYAGAGKASAQAAVVTGAMYAFDTPQSTSSKTYGVCLYTGGSFTAYFGGDSSSSVGTQTIVAKEIMG